MASVFDIFSVGVGPSSSHTVGPMRAAGLLVDELAAADDAKASGQTPYQDGVLGLSQVKELRIELFGSLGATGLGHHSDQAILLGLMGARPETIDPAGIDPAIAELEKTRQLVLLGGHPMRQHIIEGFDPSQAIALRPNKRLPFHPNSLRFHLRGPNGWQQVTYYSVGGGFVVRDDGTGQPAGPPMPAGQPDTTLPFPFTSGDELLNHCQDNGMSVAQVMMSNEMARGRHPHGVAVALTDIWHVMNHCIDVGCTTSGTLPGGLGVRRRAPKMLSQLMARAADADPLAGLDWVSLWALAVGEVNASGGRIVTAPTNGAAGIVPAVLRYALTLRTTQQRHPEGATAVVDFLLAAGAIGSIYQSGASISGAEVGCQGEIGVASSMAAAGLAQVLGGTAHQVVNAAEIGLEHHLGLTCDPVSGLVQVPCIERNAVGASTAIVAARLALTGDGHQVVSLDQVIATMMQVGHDMSSKYKETSQGGLALTVPAC